MRFLPALLTGAAIAYFFDPDSGKRRRASAKDRLGAALRRGREASETRAEYLGKRIAATPARAAAKVRESRGPRYDDATLSEKVKTELFREPSLKGHINVSAQNGVVVLVGEVDDPEKVAAMARDVAGVDAVQNLTHRPGTPAPQPA